MTNLQILKIECIKQNKKIAEISEHLGVTRQGMYYLLGSSNPYALMRIEKFLGLKSGFFRKQRGDYFENTL